jgi:hypothetical protein
MEELLVAILEIFFELFAELIGGAIIELFSRTPLSDLIPWEIPTRAFSFFLYFVCGLVAGWISLAIFPTALVQPFRVRGVSLVVAPLLTGTVMSILGRTIRRRGKRVVKIETFPYAALFAYGMALVRLLLT